MQPLSSRLDRFPTCPPRQDTITLSYCHLPCNDSLPPRAQKFLPPPLILLLSAGTYGPCLEALQQLTNGKETAGVKVSHNIVVCQYHMHGGGDVRKFYQQLSSIRDGLESRTAHQDGVLLLLLCRSWSLLPPYYAFTTCLRTCSDEPSYHVTFPFYIESCVCVSVCVRARALRA